jgi:hypothetical protein
VPTSYNALLKFTRKATNNFTNGERVYIFGSIRSSRWYFDDVKEDIVVSRKDFDVMAVEFGDFKYIAVEDSEVIKNPQNALSEYLYQYKQKYDVIGMTGFSSIQKAHKGL